MLKPITSLITLGLALGLGLGCDAEDPAEPSDRAAMILLEVDGVVVEETDISDEPELEADFALAAESAEALACVDDQVELDFVLEVDGEPTATWSECGDASLAGPSSLTAEPDAQANTWACDECEETEDCFACCRCYGGSVFECSWTC